MVVRAKNNGTVMLIAIFAIALLSAIVIGMLEMNTEELQLMRNQIYSAHAIAVAEAGLNDAFAEIRSDDTWTTGFTDKAFNGGSYTVAVETSPDHKVTSTGTSSQGFLARVEADITIGNSSPYVIRIDNLRINE
jgi:type II secretory pathway component PulK